MTLLSRSSDGEVSSPPRTYEEEMQPSLRTIPETISGTHDQNESETLQNLQETIRRLETRLERGEPSRSHRRSSSASSMDVCTVKLFKNIPEFTLDFKLQQRQEWILDLEYSFKGAKKRLRKDDQKILAALPYMSPTCRQRWYRHLAEKSREQRRGAEESWPYFTEWTLTLIKNAATLQPDMICQLQRARQQNDQDPREFHAFFAKFLPELTKYIQEYDLKLPETRDEMVTLATHHWNLLRPRHKRKRDETATETIEKNGKSGKDKKSRTPKDDSKTRKNPTDNKGNVIKCYLCDSESHLANRCPQRRKKASV